MALINCEGFEQYGSGAEFDRGPWMNGQVLDVTFGTGRFQGKKLELGNGNIAIHTPIVQTDELWAGFAIKWFGASLANHDIIGFAGATSEQVQLQLTAAGELEMRRGGTQIDITSGLGLTVGTWYYIEVHVVISNTVGEYEVRVNESAVLGPATGQDTQQDANPEIQRIILSAHYTPLPSYDDFYLCDNTGLVNNDFLGDIQVETLFPDGDGDRNDMTPLSGLTNYEMVDDGSTPDDDTTYNSGAVVGDDELYTFGDLSGGGYTIDTVHAVAVGNLLRKEEAGTRTVRALARSNVTEVEGTVAGVSADYKYNHHIYETDPDGGGAWDETAVNAAEFGLKIEA